MHERAYMCLSVLAINIANADAADAVDINDGIMRERDVGGLVPSATFSGKREAH